MNSLSKDEFRRQVRQISVNEVLSRLNSSWGQPLIDWLKSRSGIWGAFMPLADELPVSTLTSRLPNLTWVYPRVLPTDAQMVFHQADAADRDRWVQGRYTVEPDPKTPTVSRERIEGLLVPALAIDRKGQRLGRGGGYYDRFLSSFGGVKIGVVPSTRFLSSVPVEPHDLRVDAVATESELIWFK